MRTMSAFTMSTLSGGGGGAVVVFWDLDSSPLPRNDELLLHFLDATSLTYGIIIEIRTYETLSEDDIFGHCKKTRRVVWKGQFCGLGLGRVDTTELCNTLRNGFKQVIGRSMAEEIELWTRDHQDDDEERRPTRIVVSLWGDHPRRISHPMTKSERSPEKTHPHPPTQSATQFTVNLPRFIDPFETLDPFDLLVKRPLTGPSSPREPSASDPRCASPASEFDFPPQSSDVEDSEDDNDDDPNASPTRISPVRRAQSATSETGPNIRGASEEQDRVHEAFVLGASRYAAYWMDADSADEDYDRKTSSTKPLPFRSALPDTQQGSPTKRKRPGPREAAPSTRSISYHNEDSDSNDSDDPRALFLPSPSTSKKPRKSVKAAPSIPPLLSSFKHRPSNNPFNSNLAGNNKKSKALPAWKSQPLLELKAQSRSAVRHGDARARPSSASLPRTWSATRRKPIPIFLEPSASKHPQLKLSPPSHSKGSTELKAQIFCCPKTTNPKPIPMVKQPKSSPRKSGSSSKKINLNITVTPEMGFKSYSRHTETPCPMIGRRRSAADSEGSEEEQEEEEDVFPWPLAQPH